MSCGCENKKLGSDMERVWRLAKTFARMENVTIAIYKNADGTYGFTTVPEAENKNIVEFVTPY